MWLVSEDAFYRIDWCDSGEWAFFLATWLVWLWWVRIPSRRLTDVTLVSRPRHWHKLFEMVGTAWILDLLNISDHFAFWTRPLSSLENDVQIFFSLQCKIQGIFLAKKVVGHNFWTEGPTDLRSTFLSCIFDAFLGDTPLDHIFFTYAHIWPKNALYFANILLKD